MTRIISALPDVSDHYDALFVDLWGCVHNGITAYPDAVAALQAYRKRGGVVVLVTNSPKPRAGVAEQLREQLAAKNKQLAEQAGEMAKLKALLATHGQ